MSRKLDRVLDEIQKTEQKIAEWKLHLREMNAQRKLLEDAEIIKSVRSTKLEGRRLLEFLDRLREEAADALPEAGEPGKEEINMEASMEAVPEREVTGNETEI